MAENFSWAAGLDVGIGAVGGFLNWYGQSQNAKTQAEVLNARRQANNTVAASRNSLAATVRTINNARLLEAAGRELNASAETLARQRSGAAGQRFEQSIRNAEAEGAAVSNIAASGVGGSALTTVSAAIALQHGRMEVAARRQEGQVTYNTIARMSGIMSDAISSRDMSPIGGNADSVRAIDTTSGAMGLLTSLTAGVLGKKDSLQTLLGSLEPAPSATGTRPVTTPQAVAMPIDTIGGLDVASDGAYTMPVASRAVTPYYSTIGNL